MKLPAIVMGFVVLVGPAAARAEPQQGSNVLVGPVLGARLGGSPGSRLIVGVEGGWGMGPERINLGLSRRLSKTFAHVELDPWYYAGLSLGVGVDSDGVAAPVIGVWEGVPLVYPECGSPRDWEPVFTLSFGYRYTGVHELYVAPKYGATYDGTICFH